MKRATVLLAFLGLFLLAATYFPSDDLIIFRGGIRAALQDRGGQVFNVLTYKAIPNDSLDDTAAIQAAVNAASYPVCGTVLLPVGTFNVGASTFVTLKPCIRIIGSSDPHTGFGTVIQGTAGTDSFRLCEKLGGTNPDCPDYISPYTIENLTFAGGENELVARDHNTFVTLRDVMFNGPVVSAISTQGCHEEWRLHNVSMQGGQYGWRHTNTLITGHTCSNAYLDKMTFQDVLTGGQTKNNWFIEALYGNSLTWINPILNMSGEHGMHFDGGFYNFTFINLNSEGIGYLAEDNNTTGSITTGTDSLTVADATGFDIGNEITVRGAGSNYVDLTTTIDGKAGVVLSLVANAGTTVSAAACTTAKWDVINVTNSIAASAQWTFLNSAFTDLDGVRYSVNMEGGSAFSFIGSSGASASDNPVYDPSGGASIFGGAMSVRTRAGSTTDTFARNVLPGLISGTVGDETEQALIRSPDGREILLALRDSNGNGSGTYGRVDVRRFDAGRTIVFYFDPGDSVTAGTNFGDFYSRGAWINNGTTFADLGAPGTGTSIYCQDCLQGSDPCSGSSTGAWAFRINSGTPKWKCL